MTTPPTSLLITRLLETAARLRSTNDYRWTHQGRCNCGHLAQTLTGLSAARIHQMAVQSEGEWLDHAEGYCETSQQPIDTVIKQMLAFGLSVEDLADLEYLRAPSVISWMPPHQRQPDYRRKEDVIAYFETWAAVLDAERALRNDPQQTIMVNGRPYTQRKIEVIPLALDEHPDAGANAA